jgi:hypothetical protein
MPDIHQQYEALHVKNISAINRRIRAIYEKAIQQIQVTLSTVKYKGKAFNIKDYPALKKKVDSVLSTMHSSIYAVQVNGIKDSWGLSNKKNNVILDQRLAGRRVPKKVRQALYDPNAEGLTEFINRKEKGLGLSDRIWNLLDPYKKELELTMGLGLGVGRSASEIASDAKKYLNEPDKLFRRVRGEDGKLYLSAAARDYHPGQGVYRSSYKNSLRLTRTENNMAYRSADHERWSNLPFVIGIEVKTSKSHPHYDICDRLAGQYPKDFKFVGWHPQCLCYQVPKLASDDDFEKMEDELLAGDDITTEPKGSINAPPASFVKYLSENKKRISGWKNTPYFIKDNPEFMPKGFKR